MRPLIWKLKSSWFYKNVLDICRIQTKKVIEWLILMQNLLFFLRFVGKLSISPENWLKHNENSYSQKSNETNTVLTLKLINLKLYKWKLTNFQFISIQSSKMLFFHLCPRLRNQCAISFYLFPLHNLICNDIKETIKIRQTYCDL